MLNFAQKPDAVFTEILNRIFIEVIEILEEDIKDKENDGVNLYFDEKVQKMFGGTQMLLKTVQRLEVAYKSEEVYLPTDYHFLLLDRMLNFFCDVYTDTIGEVDSSEIKDYALEVNGKIILELDFNLILEMFFFDTDYDMSPEIGKFMKENPLIRGDQLGMDIEGAKASAGDLVDTHDLRLEKVKKGNEDWNDNDEGMIDEDGNSLWLIYEESDTDEEDNKRCANL